MVSKKKNNQVFLAKFLANNGVASRRKAEEIILAGQVKVNHLLVTKLTTLINPDKDKVAVDNRLVVVEKKVYYLLNKPVGYVCSSYDPHNSQSVLDLVPKTHKVHSVGRLDKDSQGLILLTNDGELTYQLTHPKFEIQKKYSVKLDREITLVDIKKLKQGIRLEEGLAKADEIKQQNTQELIIIIHQGWKRQIRRMLSALDYQVVELTRLGEGKLTLGNLPVGKYREIKRGDII